MRRDQSDLDQDQDQTDGSLWAEGDMMFRVAGAGAESDRLVKVRRPFALVGRAGGADIAIDDRAVSSSHAYLHLDPRGVYAVDLVTRTGTRINGSHQMVGWLRPGDWIEVAGRRLELIRIRVKGESIEPAPCDADLLSDNDLDTLPGVTLEPRRSNDLPWVLGSELVFLGWSASCGIQIKDTSVARTHCALVRAATGAYLVDLCGRQTWVEDRLVKGAALIHDGDLITIGSTQFTARVEPAARPARTVHQHEVVPHHEAATLLARFEEPGRRELSPRDFGPLPLDTALVPAEAQQALLAWMMGTMQGGQGEILRRQGEFQLAMTQILRQIQQDSATLLNAHLARIENIDHELSALRAEIERRNAGPPPRPMPDVPPLRIARPAPPLDDGAPNESKASTTWLLNRVNQLEDENRSAWKDLLGRLSQSRRAT
jgi:pSer/pThr/pTyr-binding forkhead associated (FHA) protein